MASFTMTVETKVPKLKETEDELLQSYLEHLHTYTTLQSGLTTSLSRSYLSLSKANFHAPAGRRYDSDWFDERLRAAARIKISSEGRLETMRKPYSKAKPKRTEIDEWKLQNKEQESEAEKKETTLSASNDIHARLENDLAQLQLDEDKTVNNSDESEEVILNPLHQFGILVPQTLRQTQREFSEAVVIMVKLVNAERELRDLEDQIRHYRKEHIKHEPEDMSK